MVSEDPIDETTHGQARNDDGAATGQGVDDDNMGEEEVAQPSEYPADLGVDHQDQSSSSSKSKRQASLPKAEADLDDTANLTQQSQVSHDSSSSSSAALHDALHKAETAIFDAYKDLVAHIAAPASDDSKRDELLTSALSSVETAMKNILVAQAAAGDSAQTRQKEVAGAQQEQGAVDRSLGVLPPTMQSSLSRDEAAVASTGPRQKEQATQALPPPQGSSAPQSGSTSSTSQTSESIDTAKCTTPHAQTAAPRQPTECFPDGWVSKPSRKALRNLLSVDELRAGEDAYSWVSTVAALKPKGHFSHLLFYNDGCVDPDFMGRSEAFAHGGWDLALDRMHRNFPLERGRALHIMMEGDPQELRARGNSEVLHTILRSVTKLREQQQQDGVGTSAQPTVEWTTVRIREHRL